MLFNIPDNTYLLLCCQPDKKAGFMHAFQALWHNTPDRMDDGQLVEVEIHPTGLSFKGGESTQQWAFDQLHFHKGDSNTSKLLFIDYRTDTLSVADYKVLDILLPYLTGTQRTQALELYGAYRSPQSKRLLSLVLIATVLMGLVLWLFFWGQIQLRKQQLALADQSLPQRLGEKHEQSLAQEQILCRGDAINRLTQQLLEAYQTQSKTSNIHKLSLFASPQIEALMLSNGHLLLSTALVQDMPWPALLAFFAHEEGHLMLNHRLESQIYAQGNQIFSRLWQRGDDQSYLLNAPLWTQYSRGQEAAADHWAFIHISQENTRFDFKALAKKALLYLDNPSQQKGFVARHPWATDRLQGIDQRLSKATAPIDQKNISLEALKKEAKHCEQKRRSGGS
jgi:Zn-dependent protease with chaperone function